jgi:hypothetical protein
VSGIINVRGIVVSKSTAANARKMSSKPCALSGKSESASVLAEMLGAPPVRRNIPRMPVTSATFRGATSIAALFEAGLAKPMPTPLTMSIEATNQNGSSSISPDLESGPVVPEQRETECNQHHAGKHWRTVARANDEYAGQRRCDDHRDAAWGQYRATLKWAV